jgi:hypothetical protein
MPKAEPGVRRAERIRESASGTRRTLIKATGAALAGAAAPLPAAPASAPSHPPDPVFDISKAWLSAQREIERLGRRWGRTEAWLRDNVGWSRLSEDERRTLPEAQTLHEIDARMDALSDENARRLRRPSRVRARTLDGLRSKLAIVVKSIEPDSHPLAYRLIVSMRRDLQAIAKAGEMEVRSSRRRV